MFWLNKEGLVFMANGLGGLALGETTALECWRKVIHTGGWTEQNEYCSRSASGTALQKTVKNKTHEDHSVCESKEKLNRAGERDFMRHSSVGGYCTSWVGSCDRVLCSNVIKVHLNHSFSKQYHINLMQIHHRGTWSWGLISHKHWQILWIKSRLL